MPPTKTIDPPTKAIVAVHGIGEQITHETIQAVAYRFCHFFDVPPAIPLGRFSGGRNLADPKDPIQPFFVERTPPDPNLPKHLRFAEVYWADVPRGLVQNKYVLEESKRWAKTVAARVGVHAADILRPGGGSPIANYEVIQTVLSEMIDTVYVLEFLTAWSKRLGLFEFDLRSLLVDFLGDVQVVTDFRGERERILEKFGQVMDVASQGADEIYVVAHSEGTVVAVLGLLTALSGASPPAWAGRVRGLMTIGSPVEVHLLLWPELWDALPKPKEPIAPKPIKWVNYLDTGDPIAYCFDKTYGWLTEHDWAPRFEWTQHEFSRYPFPGKAHIDYWGDAEVFGHFIKTVVGEEPRAAKGEPPNYSRPPRNRPFKQIAGYLLPYAVLAAVLILAVYVVYRPVFDVMTAGGDGTKPTVAGAEGAACTAFLFSQGTWTDASKSALSSATIARDVIGFALLLAGVTIAVRIPRLTTVWWLRVVGIGMFVVGAVAYSVITTDRSICAIGRSFPVGSLVGWGVWTRGVVVFNVLALVVVLGCMACSARFPHWGVRILPILGGFATLGMVACMIYDAQSLNPKANILPVVVGSAGFLYLWWLFALLFDLVFVWHRYVRFAVAMASLKPPPNRKR